MSLFDDADLAEDQDLSNWESKIVTLANKMNVMFGKRTLAKNFIAKQLIKGGLDPATLTDPAQLKDSATFKELELIFRDLSDKTDSIAGEKARHYCALFDSEMELIILTLVTASGIAAKFYPTASSIPLLRA